MKIAVVAGFDRSLLSFRGSLMQEMRARGHQIIAFAPDENNLGAEIEKLGAKFRPIAMRRTGTNMIADMGYRRRLTNCFRQEKVDAVLCYTIKPIVYGIPAAVEAGVPRRYALITGLGGAFHPTSLKGRLLRLVVVRLYRRALRHATRTIAQNRDIVVILRQLSILREDSAVSVVPGSGVDVGHYISTGGADLRPTFLFLGRILRDKGVLEFVAAARAVKATCPEARFLMVGDRDLNPAGISEEELRELCADGIVEYSPNVRDVRLLIQSCRALVLPSYHEGIPRCVLEAMSMERAVITTDATGCRDTVPDAGAADSDQVRIGANGMLVPPKSDAPLAAAMLRLARNKALAEAMGRGGRRLAEDVYDVHLVNESMIHLMNLD